MKTKLIAFTSATILLIAFTLLSSFTPDKEISNKDNTPGEVTFTVKTVTDNGFFAPKHVLAIWVEYSDEFVKTNKAMADDQIQHLYTWKTSSNYNVVDAITGATLNSHQTHTITWDCTDLEGEIVPDGQYVIWVEFTEKNAQGPLMSIEFTKGTEMVTITPPDGPNFINMELTYTPETTPTPGDISFTVKTVTDNGNYAPRHVLAIWVEHEGDFVKTRKAMANQRKQYLYTWRDASNYNVVDAITGATLTSHQTHTVTWDCTDLDGEIVPDGNYVIWVEFTEKHAQGPLTSVEFTKGTEAVTINPPDEDHFINMEFTYTPEIEPTSGDLTFTVKTVTDNGNYAPKHVLAIWVEYDGEFVKTRKAMANQRKQYLYTWKNASNYNVVDAITGATLTSHQTHTVTWDCTDLNGDIVPDGQYVVWVEFTEKHAQGPLTTVEFTKGTELVSIIPPDEPHFINMELVYEPEGIASVDFSANVTEICPDQMVVFTDNSTGANSWEWDFGDGAFPATSNTQGPHNVGYASTGNKTVSLTINGSLNQTLTDYITVYPIPMAGFTFEQNSFVVDFTNTSTNAVSYFWEFDDGETSTDENPTHVYGQDGTYEVSLTSTSEMCGADLHTETIIINTVGVSEFEYSEKLTIYPNPSNGEVYLSVQRELENVKIIIFNLQGKALVNQDYPTLNVGSVKIDGLTELQSGVYFMEVRSDQGHFRDKILIK